MKAKNWAVFALAVVAVIVIFQNTASVKTQLLFMNIEMPLFLMLFVATLVGLVFGYILGARKKK